MTSLDLQSEPPLPADCQAEGVARGEDYYEQSAAAALLGMATAMLMLPLSEYQSGTAKRELEDPRQLSDSRGSSSDDLSAYSSGSEVKRQRTETREHGGAQSLFTPVAVHAPGSCPLTPACASDLAAPPRVWVWSLL